MSILLPPIIQLVIFTTAATLDVKNVPIGILNRDNGEQAFELVQRFHGTPFFSRIIYLKGVEEIAPFIDNQKGVMVVSIDEQFSRNLDAEKTRLRSANFRWKKVKHGTNPCRLYTANHLPVQFRFYGKCRD